MAPRYQPKKLGNKLFYVRLRWLLYAALLCIVADIFLHRLPGSLAVLAYGHILFWLGAGSILLLMLLRIHLFELEITYEILHIENRSLFALPFPSSRSRRQFNFPTRKVYRVQLKRKGFRKYLELTLTNKRGEHKKMRKLDISFLARQKQEELMQWLEQLVRSNAAKNHVAE